MCIYYITLYIVYHVVIIKPEKLGNSIDVYTSTCM